jgi:hypothetical protein
MTNTTIGSLAATALIGLTAAAFSFQDAPGSGNLEPIDAPPPAERRERPSDPLEYLLEEIADMSTQLRDLRGEMARIGLERATCERELAELRQFIADHHEYGDDFREYRAVKQAAEREARLREVESGRIKREQARAERRARMDDARASRKREQAERERLQGYRDRGFSPLGLDVFLGRTGYAYHTDDTTRTRVDYEFGIGRYLRLYPGTTIDFSSMTISGSVLNASDTVRNIGIAIAFFDESGNQVGHEIVQVNNARPDVPYPFTSTIDMALDRAFATSSQYVLYSDEGGE